ncbi:site-specific integrase [Amycolatopsis vancoresmycina]|uniref:Integrase family protein n=1 Tax=Amycolatopsis vancoresmycina DSM 44592 TaxID=1292037 RepID=R1HQ07_9PSEU|nr:tyrosine-type recombinase/integrase [Amycolatopsis vancoresmycina]EOD65615.1 integrase family protein [Amycolatopsis vancoresmycina DSM 44592]
MAQPTIKKITARGKTRYQFVVDVGMNPATGKRRQVTRTFDKKTGKGGAEEALSKILDEVRRGVYAAPSKLTVGEYLDEWLRSETRGKEANTVENYRNALKPVHERYGALPLQRLSTKDVEDLVDWMLTSGRKRGGKTGTGLAPRTVQLTLSRLKSALDAAALPGRRLVEFNVAAPVKCPSKVRGQKKVKPWSTAEVKQFLGYLAASQHRLEAAAQLSLMGVGPAELCGLKWEDHVTLDPEGEDEVPTIIAGENTRTIVWTESGGVVDEKDGKTENRDRTLPLPAPSVAALRRFKARQARERLLAGEAYEASGYVLVDELGQPVRTDWLRRRIYALMDAASVRRVRLYDARHACLTFLRMSGVPGPIVSAWAGHGDLTIADRVYTHPEFSHLRQASDQLGTLLG